MKKSVFLTICLILMIGLTACESNTPENNTKVDNEQKEQNDISDNITDEIKDELLEDIADISKKVTDGAVEGDEAEELMMEAIKNSKTMQDEYTKQKTLMPVYMSLSKDLRACLVDADNLSDANTCGDEAEKKAEKLGLNDEEEYEDDEEEDFGNWTNVEKESFINDLDKGLLEMEKASNCFEKSDDFVVAMQCIQALQE